ncbi:TolC family protein [Terracidiphilus gabretensis]|uniref:TolC family protein n=1 Tax=Terracidiphilus gabretensis TaxID=1577687 RepID=UPI00071B4890|nr:TolC family protein [Terracidiphilus gabretensis]
MPLENSRKFRVGPCACAVFAALMLGSLSAGVAGAQTTPTAAGPTAQSFQGSVAEGTANGQVMDLTLDDAIQRGLRTNLGVILSGTQTASAKGQRLSQLQNLLPSVDASFKESYQQVDLAAEGIRFPGFPTIIGPYGFTDIRASLTWSLVDVKSLRSYIAAKHNFAAAQLTADDAKQMVILTVGNAYLLVVADETEVASVQAQVTTSKVSLDQAVANHEAGTAPKIDELRARVDYQTLEQQLISAQNALEKDRLSLARTIGLPLDQKFNVADRAPYAAFDEIDLNAALKQAHVDRKDLAAMVEQTKAAELQRKAATAERFPMLKVDADYGDIGVNVGNSHGTVDASGNFSVPVFKEFGIRGDEQQAQSQLDTAKAQLSDKNAQVDADVRDALLDIESAQKQVEVAKSNVDLASEALSEAQQRYKAGVSDNLPVSQAEQSVAQANDQYVSSLYRHNVAKLSLARSLGAAGQYKTYLEGKQGGK